MEQTLQTHFASCAPARGKLNHISVNLGQSQITDRHKTSFMSSASGAGAGGTSRRQPGAAGQGEGSLERERGLLSKANAQLKRC